MEYVCLLLEFYGLVLVLRKDRRDSFVKMEENGLCTWAWR